MLARKDNTKPHASRALRPHTPFGTWLIEESWTRGSVPSMSLCAMPLEGIVTTQLVWGENLYVKPFLHILFDSYQKFHGLNIGFFEYLSSYKEFKGFRHSKLSMTVYRNRVKSPLDHSSFHEGCEAGVTNRLPTTYNEARRLDKNLWHV